MRFAVFKETVAGETRVALVPDAVKLLLKNKHAVLIETGAGLAASIPDAEYEAAGAQIVLDAKQLAGAADCVLKVRPLSQSEAAVLPEGKAVIGYLAPLRNPELVQILAQRRLTSFSLDAVPRISRAQSMDILSSMATISGYKAVLLAASHLPKFLPMLTTAAGTIRPAQGLILGAGVAGLQAIATARRLGAVVEAFDVRPAVKEQVQSLGAKFLEIPLQENLEDKGGYARQVSAETLAKQQELLAGRLKVADFVITTAQVPGKPAPRLITKAMVSGMKPGSVIVDLAAESGGNCELTKADAVTSVNGVTILGPTNLPATLPLDASRMFARNLATFILEITNETGFTFDWKNEIFAETCITHDGEVTQEEDCPMIIGALAMIYIFILAIFTGVEVISRVPTVLHTPLMSGANAIHGVVLIGGVILLGMSGESTTLFVLGFIAVILGTLNVVGGFVVTDRMLEMFKAKEPAGEKKEEGK